jgi:hypothetical protein
VSDDERGAPGATCNSFIICRFGKLNIKVVSNKKTIVGISLFVCLYRYMFLVGPEVFRFMVKGVKAIFLWVQRGWGLL